MDIDYKAIKEENLRKYGTDIGRIGDMLLANRYDDRTHFIYEILQNAEDALKKRGGWEGSRTVEFSVSSDSLTISHFGKPFDEADVRGVCGIGESTKELTDIGRFGIGFKSVYAFTDRPEIHSGDDHFAIESYVWPVAVDERRQHPEETTIYIPFLDEEGIKDDVLQGLQRLGPRTLLFLREIEEISWKADDGSWGRYARGEAESKGKNTRKVALTGENYERDGVEEEWMAFSGKVYHKKKSAGHVEVAFLLNPNGKGGGRPSIKQLKDSSMVVFFPTIVSTHMGFIVQGPYRTTPSRDNIPEDDPWNKHLVRETAKLLVGALKRLKSLGLLDVSAIECLPLEPPPYAGIIRHWTDGSRWRFAPLFEAVKDALITEPLLPAYQGGHIAGENAALARSQELRELVNPEQLTRLLQAEGNIGWLSEEITPDRTSEVHTYITSVLDIDEVTPESLVRRLSLNFLEDQSDDWLKRLYEFLNGRKGLLSSLKSAPLVRLENGTQTTASSDNKPNAYLPGDTPTNYPTVRQSVCQSKVALDFLTSLGLRVPEPVDDVIENILPRYSGLDVNISNKEYEDHIQQILIAFDTDSVASRTRLTAELRKVRFVAVVDAGKERASDFAIPANTYMATERLARLFEGVPGILMVDNSRECLKGDQARRLIRAVGTSEFLLPVETDTLLEPEEKRTLRLNSIWADEKITPWPWRDESVEDYTLRGLDSLLEMLSGLPSEEAYCRSELLWQALRDVQREISARYFEGTYRWFYRSNRWAKFPAKFVRVLNEVAWVPDKDGVLQIPREVFFADTGWEADPNLLSKIEFKPAVIGALAKEAGIEPEILDVLKMRGITTKAQLIDLLGLNDDLLEIGVPQTGETDTSEIVSDQVDEGSESKDSSENGAPESQVEQKRTAPNGSDERATGSVEEGQDATYSPTGEAVKTKAAGRREFVSYIAVSPEEPSEKSDGLSHEERIRLEDKAIDFIISKEPSLRRMGTNNPGFDLREIADGGEIVRFVEVKAMSGTLQNRSATLTKKQFEFAQQERDSYWLYIVESAGDPERANIVKINDPAGWAKTFTFDHGWKEVSQDAK